MLTKHRRGRILEELNAVYSEHCVRSRDFSNAEAFALMTYGVPDGPPEGIWNSRNGVTPYGCASRDGKSTVYHLNFHRDRCVPTYKPPVGSRIFVDDKPEDVLRSVMEQVERNWDNATYPMKEGYETKGEAVESIALGCYTPGIPPRVIVVTEYLARTRGWLTA